MPKFDSGAAIGYLQERFGGFIRSIPTDLNTGVAPIQVAQFSGERVSLIFVNLSANEIYLALTANPTAARGIRLAPLGGMVALNLPEDGILACEDWWALATGANSALYRIEVVREGRT